VRTVSGSSNTPAGVPSFGPGGKYSFASALSSRSFSSQAPVWYQLTVRVGG